MYLSQILSMQAVLKMTACMYVCMYVSMYIYICLCILYIIFVYAIIILRYFLVKSVQPSTLMTNKRK